MGRFTAALLASVVSLGSIVHADDNKKDNTPFDDATFVKKAASGGMCEVALGKIAQLKAKNEQVKAFAERMVTDHTKANEELKKMASAAGFKLPEEMTEHDQKEVERFHDYKGSNFDSDYVKHMLIDHEKDVELFTRATKEAKNPAIKEFAEKTLPVLKEHLAAAKKIKLPE